jgi:prephenate dehydratase
VVGFLGPEGTFTEQALLTQPDLAAGDLRPLSSISDVIAATSAGEIDLGFVPIENAIEGSVNVTLDSLAFEADLLIQREVVISIELDLLAPPGASLEGIQRVLSMPMATAQCRLYLNEHLPGVELEATNSTADAARIVGERGDTACAAISPRRAGELHHLDTLATDVEDHPENQTRFVAVAPTGIPAPTGHDKSMIVVFQRADRPGSLLSILQEFAARAVNLTKLESRPTKKGLGDYCFIIDLEGHITDELVADCLRDIHSKQQDVKFLGSFPAAGVHGPEVRREAVASWREAAAWIDGLRAQVDD